MVYRYENDWEFKVRGSPHLLRGLGDRFNGLDVLFVNNPDDFNDTISDDFGFRTWFCNNITDRNQACQIGYELISLVNGAFKVIDDSHEEIVITGLLCGQTSCELTPFYDDIRLTDGDISSTEENKKKHLAQIVISKVFTMIDLSKRRDDVYFLLKLFSMELNWVVLYKIMETVEYFSREKSITVTFDKSKKNAFTGSANNFSVSGLSSRHGPNVKGTPKKTMTLSEAESFIRELTCDYLKLADALS